MKSANRPMTRRRFQQTIGVALAGAFGLPRISPSNNFAAEPARPRGRYFDIHTHVGRVWNKNEALSAEVLLRWMDAHDIAQAAVLPLVSPEASSYPISTDDVLAATAPHRDRLIPFCSVDPRTSYAGGHQGLVAMLQAYVEAGAKGFGEHKPGVPIDDPRNMALYAACAELRLPVLFHLDNLRNMDAPGLPGLEKVLKTFPTGVFIGHGPGWWASIAGNTTQADLGGYPRGPVAPGGAIDRLMQLYPNLYGDLSAGSGVGAIRRDPEFGRQFLIRRADRLLFGSDFLAPGQDVPQLEFFGQVELPTDVQEKIFRGNARRLLGIA
jgi:predicted TIM-barrel fold metal-dependent hydrolase